MAKYEPNVKIPCVYMRGGTSKAVFFRDEDLPQDPKERDKVILSAFGSPDRRQIDGMGGANTSTSKVAIIKNGKIITTGITEEIMGNDSLEHIFLELTDDE